MVKKERKYIFFENEDNCINTNFEVVFSLNFTTIYIYDSFARSNFLCYSF